MPATEWPHLATDPAARRDAYLYLLENRDWPGAANGLVPDAAKPPTLLERGALAEALRRLAEDDAATPTALACFRVRRYLVPGIQDDPDATARLGAPCYLLTGP